MENVILIFVLAAILGGAAVYIISAKKRGVKCIGCPAGGTCGQKKDGVSCGGCSGCNGGVCGGENAQNEFERHEETE